MKYYKIAPRLTRILGLEIFVFVSFLAICALINLIAGIQNDSTAFWNFIIGAGKVVLSFILVGTWLSLWYYLTKKLIKVKKEENLPVKTTD